MSVQFRNLVIAGLAAVGFAAAAGTAVANPYLPVSNLTFSTYSGSNPKGLFSAVNPAGWVRGTVANNIDLVFIDAPGTATGFSSPNYPVYGPFADPPSGGNFIQADGNPDYESVFGQLLTGLVVGTQYDLSFYQAAGQQQSFSGPTTEQWRVFFGTDLPSAITLSGPTAGVYSVNVPGGTVEQDSPIMNTPSQGVTPWNQVTLTFTATSTSEYLTFLAWGNGGSNANQPPTVFLAGVNGATAPEPATLSIMGVALAGLGGLVSRRRAKRNAAV